MKSTEIVDCITARPSLFFTTSVSFVKFYRTDTKVTESAVFSAAPASSSPNLIELYISAREGQRIRPLRASYLNQNGWNT